MIVIKFKNKYEPGIYLWIIEETSPVLNEDLRALVELDICRHFKEKEYINKIYRKE